MGAFLTILWGCAGKHQESPTAQHGLLDLSEWDFSRNGNVTLKGDWLLLWDEFQAPGSIETFRQLHQNIIQVPGLWHTQNHPTLLGQTLPSQGHATYVVEVKLPPGIRSDDLSISTQAIGTAANWTITEPSGSQSLGKMNQGVAARSLNGTIPVRVNTSINLGSSEQKSIVIWVHLSNYHVARGGIWNAPHLGLSQVMAQAIYKQTLLNAAILGLLMIVALYHLVLFLQRREDLPSLYFALVCLAVGLLHWMSSRFFQQLGMGWSQQGFHWVSFLENIAMPLCVMSMYAFIHSLLPNERFKELGMVLGHAAGAALILLTLFTEPTTYSSYLYLYHLHILGALLCVVGFLGLKSIQGSPLARWVLLGFGVLIVGTANDIMLAMQIIDTIYIGPFTFIAFVVLQSGILSNQVSKAFKRAEHLGQHLQREVTERTEDLRFQTAEAQNYTREALRQKAKAESARLASLELKEEAERYAEQLEEMDRVKTQFFQNMSHELRTPLTLILNPLESQRREQPDNRDIEIATKNSMRLLRLVNQLLDFQKISAGKSELKLEPLDLNRFIHICGDYFHSACSNKDIEFTVTRDGQSLDEKEPPVWVMSETDALEKVVFNYLSNALKYTPTRGSIELGFTVQDNHVKLFVRDTGPGISKPGQAKLFEVFSQVDETTTRAYEGTGLGLALVKSLIEQMNGQVDVESEVGTGSTFLASIPLCPAPENADNLEFSVKEWLLDKDQGETGTETTQELEALPDIGERQNGLVLVVDDLADMRTLIGGTLQKSGYHVITAPNGKRGLELAQELQPDLILTDWMMPQMSGPELIAAVKDDPKLSSTPMILLTAKSDDESKVLGTEIGANAFLGKPFNDQELTSMVRNMLSLKAREREVEELNHQLTENVLKRYLPPGLVEDIIRGDFEWVVEPRRRSITVLFSDLCGFTQLGTQLSAKEYADQLNDYLTLMNEIIFANYGTIDKFMGDAIMVVFGAPQEMDSFNQAQRAVTCARGMQNGLDSLNEKWKAKSLPQLQARIGIHQGDAIVGNFGSERRSDYTCIGTAVNLASRIEGACSPGEVFVSGVIQKLLPDEVESAGKFKLKGIDEEQELHRLV
ncbi:MAG: response regulator [Deltaproteobacteria bacterium]|nr:response regulator [Deltaproteobacteria bacterium]